MRDPETYLNEHRCWVFKVLPEVVQPLGSYSAIDRSVVAAQCDRDVITLLETEKHKKSNSSSRNAHLNDNLPLL